MTEDALTEALAMAGTGELARRCEGVAKLAAIEGDEAACALAALLEESSWYLRERVVEELASRRDATEAVRRVLREGSWFARASACDALGALGASEATPDVVALLENRYVSVQKSAVRALERIAARHGDDGVARAVAALAPAARRRARARIGHQAPDWIGALDRSIRALGPEALGRDEGEPEPAPAGSGTERILRFRRWLSALPSAGAERER